MMNKKRILALSAIFLLGCFVGIAFAYTNTIDTSLPAGSDDPAEADDNMRRIQGGFQEILAVEHNVDLTGTVITGDGTHTAITADSVTSAGAISGTSITGSTTLAITGNGTIGGTLGVTGVTTLGDASLLATSAAPTTDAMLANKKYVDDQFPDDDAFGTWASKSNNTDYLAASDGIVCAWSNTGTGAVNGLTDAATTPTTVRISDATSDSGNSRGVTFPVKKGHYWKVTGAATVYWLPIGG